MPVHLRSLRIVAADVVVKEMARSSAPGCSGGLPTADGGAGREGR